MDLSTWNLDAGSVNGSKVEKTDEGYQVTSINFPGKVWTGETMSKAIAAAEEDFEEFHRSLEPKKPSWMTTWKQKKTE